MKSIQELARAIAKINWSGVQNDPIARAELDFIKKEVLKLEKFDAVSLLFEVMEAQHLNWAYPHTVFTELLTFNRMHNAYTSFVPSTNGDVNKENPDDWYDLCVKLDTMARYKDNKHFGLPMGDIIDFISAVSQQYTLTKKAQ